MEPKVAHEISGQFFKNSLTHGRGDLASWNNSVRVRLAYFSPACACIFVTLALGGAMQTFASAFNVVEPPSLPKLVVIFCVLPLFFAASALLADVCLSSCLDGMNRPPLTHTRAAMVVGAGLTQRSADLVVIAAVEAVPLLHALFSCASDGFSGTSLIAGYVEGGLIMVVLLCSVKAVCGALVQRCGKLDEYDATYVSLHQRMLGEWWAADEGGRSLVHEAAIELTELGRRGGEALGLLAPEEPAEEAYIKSRRFWTATAIACQIALILLVYFQVIGCVVALPALCLILVMFTKLLGSASHRNLYLLLVSAFFLLTCLLAGLAARSEQAMDSRGLHFLDPPASAHAAEYHQEYNPSMFPLCLMRWGALEKRESERLTAIDLVALSEAVYMQEKEDILSRIRRDFEGTDLAEVELEDVAEDFNTIGRWALVKFPAAKTKVFVIRGTATKRDIFADVDMWCAVAVLQFFDEFVPITAIFPQRTLRNLLRLLVLHRWLGEDSVWKQHIERAARAKERAEGEGYQLVVTGHSLGGGLASIVGSRLHLPTLAVSPPGSLLSAGRFLTTVEELQNYVSVVMPRHDKVPEVDLQAGNVQHIPCDDPDPLTCHMLGMTVRTLYGSCRDPRGRTMPDEWEPIMPSVFRLPFE